MFKVGHPTDRQHFLILDGLLAAASPFLIPNRKPASVRSGFPGGGQAHAQNSDAAHDIRQKGLALSVSGLQGRRAGGRGAGLLTAGGRPD
jgi:hypothetical protein